MSMIWTIWLKIGKQISFVNNVHKFVLRRRFQVQPFVLGAFCNGRTAGRTYTPHLSIALLILWHSLRIARNRYFAKWRHYTEHAILGR